MNPTLTKKLTILANQKSAVLSRISQVHEDRLRSRPHPGAWCFIEVVDHLVKTEAAVLVRIRENLATPHLVSLRDRLGGMMVLCAMYLPTRVKVPSGAEVVVPEAVDDVSKLELRWSAIRDELGSLIASLQESQVSGGVFRHPVAGWMDVSQTLSFISAHLRHHEYQLNRLDSNLRSK